MQTEQTTKTPAKKTVRFKWFVAACCLGGLLLIIRSQYCPPDYYASLSYRHLNYAMGERAVMRKFSDMFQECPGASRYIIKWCVESPRQDGIFPFTTIYDRKKKTFHYYFGYIDDYAYNPIWSLSDVTIEDIHSVAAPGDFDRLRERVRRLRAQKKQQ